VGLTREEAGDSVLGLETLVSVLGLETMVSVLGETLVLVALEGAVNVVELRASWVDSEEAILSLN
jgi:hypothetical protein